VNTKALLDRSGLIQFLENHESFYIVGHKEPDGDCLGSQMALASFLRRQGKRTLLLSSGPFTRTEIAPFASQFQDHVSSPVVGEPESAIIVLDCSSLSRIGPIVEELPAGAPLAFIDHHAAGTVAGDVQFVDPESPAVAYLIQLIIEAMGEHPDADEAEYLLFGICTDTGFFRHLDQRSGDIFAAVGRLVEAGASPKQAFDAMNGGKPFESRKLMGELLTRAELRYDGRLVITSMNLDDQQRYGLIGRDSDMLYQLLLTVAGIEVAVVVRQENAAECTVGFRSRASIDVASIAAVFGGGGHRLAAGLHMKGQSDDVVELVSAAFESAFRDNIV
jgi:phosphoesterase RecJ-like protein